MDFRCPTARLSPAGVSRSAGSAPALPTRRREAQDDRGALPLDGGARRSPTKGRGEQRQQKGEQREHGSLTVGDSPTKSTRMEFGGKYLACLPVLAAQIEQLEAAVAAIEKQLMAWHKSNPVSQRLASVPGIGPIIATAIAATVVEPSGFRSGREFAAWLGLVPRQNSTGGKHR